MVYRTAAFLVTLNDPKPVSLAISAIFSVKEWPDLEMCIFQGPAIL